MQKWFLSRDNAQSILLSIPGTEAGTSVTLSNVAGFPLFLQGRAVKGRIDVSNDNKTTFVFMGYRNK